MTCLIPHRKSAVDPRTKPWLSKLEVCALTTRPPFLHQSQCELSRLTTSNNPLASTEAHLSKTLPECNRKMIVFPLIFLKSSYPIQLRVISLLLAAQNVSEKTYGFEYPNTLSRGVSLPLICYSAIIACVHACSYSLVSVR